MSLVDLPTAGPSVMCFLCTCSPRYQVSIESFQYISNKKSQGSFIEGSLVRVLSAGSFRGGLCPMSRGEKLLLGEAWRCPVGLWLFFLPHRLGSCSTIPRGGEENSCRSFCLATGMSSFIQWIYIYIFNQKSTGQPWYSSPQKKGFPVFKNI